MPWRDEYYKDGTKRRVMFVVDGGNADVPVQSGELRCPKCKSLIPDKEMFCIPCFGQQPPRKPKLAKVKPDAGGLFDSSVAVVLGKEPERTCEVCATPYIGLICGNCLLGKHYAWMKSLVEKSVKNGNQLHFTRNGHLTLSRDEWRKVLRDHGMTVTNSSEVVAVCGAQQTISGIADMDPWYTECADCKAVQP